MGYDRVLNLSKDEATMAKHCIKLSKLFFKTLKQTKEKKNLILTCI